MKRELGAERLEYYKWAEMKVRVPRSKSSIARKLGVTFATIKNWERELFESAYNSKDYFLSRKREIDIGMAKAAERGNAQMALLIKKITGEFVEKVEKKKKELSADDLSRLTREAEDETRTGV